MRVRNQLTMVFLIMMIGLFTGCGGSGGGSSGGGNISGGIGGTGRVAASGSGTITDFGSIIVNDTREFEIDDNTEVAIDGEQKTEAELEQEGEGLRVRFLVGEDVNDDFTAGTAVRIEADNNLKGPVTGTDPLRVLGQDVVVTGDTVLANLGTVSQLDVGDIVEVSGFASTENVVQATRLQFKPAGAPVWKLTGTVTSSGNNTVAIGEQFVDITGVELRDCPADPVGQFVEIKLSPDGEFTSGDTLDTVTDFECQIPGLLVPDDAEGDLKAEVEGLVTAIRSSAAPNAEIEVGGQPVAIDPFTQFEGGDFTDIALGVKLEAEGDLNVDTGVLTADKVSFRETRVRIRAAADEVDINDMEITVLGTLDVHVTEITEFPDNDLLSLDEIVVGVTELEIRGFVDRAGVVFATEVGERGDADGRVRLRGPVDAGSVTDPTFRILGVTVDTSETGDDFFIEDNQIDRAAFFSLISQPGASAEADGDFVGSVIQANEVEIED